MFYVLMFMISHINKKISCFEANGYLYKHVIHVFISTNRSLNVSKSKFYKSDCNFYAFNKTFKLKIKWCKNPVINREMKTEKQNVLVILEIKWFNKSLSFSTYYGKNQ